MSAARPAASARLPGSGSTDRLQGDFGAHIRHPKFPTYHPSGALAPPLLILQPAVHSCAAYLAAALLSAQVLPPANGCPGFAHQVLASRRKMSSVKPCPVTTIRPALGVCLCVFILQCLQSLYLAPSSLLVLFMPPLYPRCKLLKLLQITPYSGRCSIERFLVLRLTFVWVTL